MKHKFLILVAVAFMHSANLIGQCSDFITVDGKKLKCGSSDFFAVVANYWVEVTRGPLSNASVYTYPNNYYPSRGHGYFPTNTFYPTIINNAKADSSMRKDFRAMKAKGINTIRVYGCGYTDTTSTTDWNGNNYIRIPFSNTLYTPLLLDIAGGVLRSAKAAGLKVIFLAGGNRLGNNDPTNAAYHAGYIDYLQKFGQRFGNDPTLLAVDFFNEPTASGQAYWLKNQACQKVKEWNDALKLYSNALSTIGLWEVSSAFNWDPNLMNVDFLSLHDYPFTNVKGYTTNLTNEINRMKSDYWWYKNNVKLPWIIGETGMTAHRLNISTVDTLYDNSPFAGTIQDQVTFLHETLNASRDYGATGYSWWEYSDQNPGGYAQTGIGSYWGLIESNDGKTASGATPASPIVWKAAAQEIANFNPYVTGTAVQPPNYYNYTNEPITTYNTVRGVVYYAGTFDPVKDALIELLDNTGKFYYTYTYGDGSYLIPKTVNSIIQRVKVTAAECDIVYQWNNFSLYPGTAHFLNKLQRPTTNTLNYNNSSVSSANVSSYALVNINFSNYQISSSNFKATAGSYVNLQAGFSASSNTNFNAHVGPYYQDCGSFSFRKSNDNEESETAEEKTKEELLQTRIFPNPGAGIYYIEIEREGSYDVTISNMYGAVVKTYSFKGNQGSVLLENESPGIYLFTIKGQDSQVQNFKVIKE